MEIEIRKATPEDCNFIAETIISSESTGHEVITFSKMYGLEPDDLIPIFAKIVNNDIHGHTLSWTSYLIAHQGKKRCGSLAAFIEGENGDSNIIMTNALMKVLDRDLVLQGFKFAHTHSETIIPKTKGALQIDCGATYPEFRGKGIFSMLSEYAENLYKDAKLSEIQVWQGNGAIKLYNRLGYYVYKTHPSKAYPNKGKILTQKDISNL